MTEKNRHDFSVGDIILYHGEAYQVYENMGEAGRVGTFPGEPVEMTEIKWDEHCRKIGHEPLPAPAPCASGGCCPSRQ